jgi:hypothetical protein
MLEPSARNSNLLPVKANGEVRLRSPPCIGRCGSTGAPMSSVCASTDTPWKGICLGDVGVAPAVARGDGPPRFLAASCPTM